MAWCIHCGRDRTGFLFEDCPCGCDARIDHLCALDVKSQPARYRIDHDERNHG